MIRLRPVHSPRLSPIVVSIRDRHVPSIVPRRSDLLRPPRVATGASPPPEAHVARSRGYSTAAAHLVGSIAAGGVIGRLMFGHGVVGLAVGAVAGAVSLLPGVGSISEDT